MSTIMDILLSGIWMGLIDIKNGKTVVKCKYR